MTDPTPTRAEVERHPHWSVTVETSGDHIITLEPECYGGREPSAADEVAIRTAAHHLLSFIGDDTPEALRERAEAAQKNYLDTRMEVTLLEEAHSTVSGALATALEQLTAARRAEAAAWNDAIEAFTAMVMGFERDWSMKWRDQMIREARALRRAAPTEDR